MSDLEDKWYRTFYSIIFLPAGEIPQTKGHWEDSKHVEEMIPLLKKEHPGARIIVATSRCGEINVQDATEWLQMLEAYAECEKEEADYIRKGICSDCGACSAKEAETKCRPHASGDSGEYTCAGDLLWREEQAES